MESKLDAFYSERNLDQFKLHCYQFASTQKHSCILDSCSLDQNGDYEFLAGYGSKQIISDYSTFQTEFPMEEWVFGVFPYDLKNQFEQLESQNPDTLELPELYLFIPDFVISISKSGEIKLETGELPSSFFASQKTDSKVWKLEPKKAEEKQEYLSKIKAIQELILDGEVYELNYCRERIFLVEDFDPIVFHQLLLTTSPVPMAALLNVEGYSLSCASMERFIRKKGCEIISQPIKGTIGRSIDSDKDKQLKKQLEQSKKDQAENVMIVDLVRNDLARICESGSIEVDELFKVYPFQQVYQMISTVRGKLREEISLSEILKATFPMGSMTGTPKIAAMKHIEQLENFKRSWFSGSVGYMKPNGDFDLNVVIRSLFYSQSKQLITLCTGGAITIDSDPLSEWEECLLKASAIEKVLLD